LHYQQLNPYNSTHQCRTHFDLRNFHTLNQSSSVATVTRLRGLDGKWVRVPFRRRERFLLLSPAFTTGSAALLCKRNWGFFGVLKRPGREPDHSLQKTLLRGLNCVALHLHVTLRLHNVIPMKHRDILNLVIYTKFQNMDQNMRLLDSVQFSITLYEFADTNLMEFEPADAFLYLDSPREWGCDNRYI